MTTTETLKAMKAEAAALWGEEVPVAHNEGTFSAEECQRKTGSGRPEAGNYTIYERVGDGRKRVVGCDPAKAPGYTRGSRDTLSAKKARLSELNAEIKAASR